MSLFAKHVHVWRECPACKGNGKQDPEPFTRLKTQGKVGDLLLLVQGICLACKGAGGAYHRVLEDSPDAKEKK